MEMVNAVAANDMGHLIVMTVPSNTEVDRYLLHNGIYDAIRPYISDYFVRNKNGVFTCNYRRNKNVAEHMFVKVGHYMVNVDFSKLG